MVINAEKSSNIPLRACGFTNIELCPLPHKSRNSSNLSLKADASFEWTEKANISLMKDELDIFEQPPQIVYSKLLGRKNKNLNQDNNKIFMVLNSNIYSIRSYVDFNTQQTEFISMRYISISPPFTFQNLIPAPISLFLKDISRKKI